MIDTILHLLSPAYLFNKNLGEFTSDLAVVYISFNVGLIVLAILIPRLAKKGDLFANKASSKFKSFAWTMGAFGIILYIFRQINIFYLSAPILILVWLIISSQKLLITLLL